MKYREKIRVLLMAWIGIVFAGFAGMFAPGAYAEAQKAEIVIIGHQNLPESILSKMDIQNIFLGKKTILDNANITCVILKGGQVHEKFLKTYLARTPSQYEQYWKKLVFSGQGKSPKAFETEEALFEYVKNTAGAIGYIGAATAQQIESGSMRQFGVQ